jgi:hypothetical protein
MLLGNVDSILYRRPRLVNLYSEILEIEAIEFAKGEWKSAQHLEISEPTQGIDILPILE